jgi:4'-phosphopantetheinyl transferase
MLPVLSIDLLRPEFVHVWQVGLEVSPGRLAECWALLSEDERGRAMKFRLPEHQRRYAAGRGFVRLMLAGYVGGDGASLRFIYGRAGKPELIGGEVQFNVSHCGDRALLAVSREMVGVDLEEIRVLDYQAVGREVLTAENLMEVASVMEEHKAAAFCRHWVRGEARLKALGLGIGERRRPEIPVYDLEAGPGYCAALATHVENPRIELRDGRGIGW